MNSAILNTEWFQVFATFVGVNTIVYVGLTAAKLIPWPHPVHPDRARDILGRSIEGEPVVEPIIPAVSMESVEESGIFDIARAFGWLGAIVLLVGVLSVFARASQIAGFVAMGAGLLLLGAAQVLARRRVSLVTASWLWSMSISLLAAGVAFWASIGPIERVGITLVLAVLLGAVALTWPSFLVAASVLLFSFVRIGLDATNHIEITWVPPLAAGLLAGMMLMVLRRRTLAVLSEVDRLSNQLGSTDLLTGVLTREGVLTLDPTFRSVARRAGESVFVLVVRIAGFSEAVGEYGQTYGDDLLRGTADALRASVSDGDLVARWTDEEFLVMGIGSQERATQLAAIIQTHAETAPVSLGKAPLRLQTAFETSAADDTAEDAATLALTHLADSPR